MDYKQIKADMEKLGEDLHQAAKNFEDTYLSPEIRAEYQDIQHKLESGYYGRLPLSEELGNE